eukprot:gene8200-8391_t
MQETIKQQVTEVLDKKGVLSRLKDCAAKPTPATGSSCWKTQQVFEPELPLSAARPNNEELLQLLLAAQSREGLKTDDSDISSSSSDNTREQLRRPTRNWLEALPQASAGAAHKAQVANSSAASDEHQQTSPRHSREGQLVEQVNRQQQQLKSTQGLTQDAATASSLIGSQAAAPADEAVDDADQASLEVLHSPASAVTATGGGGSSNSSPAIDILQHVTSTSPLRSGRLAPLAPLAQGRGSLSTAAKPSSEGLKDELRRAGLLNSNRGASEDADPSVLGAVAAAGAAHGPVAVAAAFEDSDSDDFGLVEQQHLFEAARRRLSQQATATQRHAEEEDEEEEEEEEDDDDPALLLGQAQQELEQQLRREQHDDTASAAHAGPAGQMQAALSGDDGAGGTAASMLTRSLDDIDFTGDDISDDISLPIEGLDDEDYLDMYEAAQSRYAQPAAAGASDQPDTLWSGLDGTGLSAADEHHNLRSADLAVDADDF